MNSSGPIFVDKKSDIGVLMLHGFTSTPDQFKELSDFLVKRGFSVLVPVVAGHGTCPADLEKTSPEDWKQSAKAAYLELKKVSKKIFIIGNSFGSNLAFWLVREFDNEPIGVVSLGAPIFMRYHKFILCRLYTYGLLQKNYRKPRRIYRTDYTDFNDEITYPIIPCKSLRDFFGFLKNETVPNLNKIKIPILVGQSDSDNVVKPKSATYIYEHVGSELKRIYWFPGKAHVIMSHKRRDELFEKIYSFLTEITHK